ncbi:hypothetical protein N9L68_03570 [bacterium]|nr:hypothetical protein [bacterium]
MNVKDSREAIEELMETITDPNVTIETETVKVGDPSTDISDTEKDMFKPSSVRTKEKATSQDMGEELSETVGKLSDAGAAIRGTMPFVQAPGGEMSAQDLETMRAAEQSLVLINEASFVTPKQEDQVAALMQGHADAAGNAEPGSRTVSIHAIMDTLADRG